MVIAPQDFPKYLKSKGRSRFEHVLRGVVNQGLGDGASAAQIEGDSERKSINAGGEWSALQCVV